MKKQVLVLLVILASTVFFGNVQVQADDPNPATVSSVWFDPANATVGDLVTVYVDIYDPDELSYVEVGLYRNSTAVGQYWWSWIVLEFDGTYWSGTFDIGQYSPSDLYVYEVYYNDQAGNWDYLIHNTDFISPVLDTYGTIDDNEGPILNSIWFGQSSVNVTTTETRVQVYANITDNLSGVRDGWADIYKVDPNATYYWNGQYVNTVYLEYDSVTGLYVGEWFINQYRSSGQYHIPWLSLYDNARNYRSYENYTFAENPLIPPVISVFNPNGDEEPPVLNDYYFGSSEVSIYERQYLYANISDNYSGFDFGYFEIAYLNDFNNTVYVGTAYLYQDSLDPTTGLYSGYVDYNNFVPSNTTLFVNYVYLYDRAYNYQYSYLSGDLPYRSYFITSGSDTEDTTLDQFTISISPDQGVNDVGQPVLFEVEMFNNRSNEIDGWFYLDVLGPENYPAYADYLYLGSYSNWYESIELVFSTPGDYQVKASFEAYNGAYFEAYANWTVNPEPVDEKIEVSVSPRNGQSNVNETVDFNVEAKSSFLHDMPNVTLIVTVEDDRGVLYEETFFFELPGGASISEVVSVLFPVAGSYKVSAVIVDDIGTEWVFEFGWEVVGDGTSTDTNTDTNSTQTTDGNSNQTTGVPEIELPGFELPIAILSFGFIATIVRRRNY
ncbi:MAG: DUF7035 domain-containing protein [Candidatus Kariarchaeaceae archaeon]|jgi:hypothetical protein